ncbi:hypothetical protein OROHE_022174 [Orobanche hederae]
MNIISDITPAKETWKLHVRVERLWTTIRPIIQLRRDLWNSYYWMQIMLLLGDKIQASVPKYLISKFEKLIKEGGFYRFTNFEIEQNKEEFIAMRHPYRLKFHKFTSPRPAESLPIPKCGFKLIPFAEFGTEKCYATLLVNVIAEVLNVGDVVELNKNGQCTKRVTIHLLDSMFEKLIKEGGFYRFTNFETEQNNEEFIATRHPYRLKIHKFMSPRPAESLPIPKYEFKLIPFAEFGIEKCYAKLLVDVIAEVLNVGDIVELNKNGQCKRVTIHLLDFICGDTIECTLWNNYADQMVN